MGNKGRVKSHIADNREFIDRKNSEDNAERKNRNNNDTGKWLFRIFSLFLLILICAGIIHLEFQAMKKDKTLRADAITMTSNIHNAMTELQNSWDTMYYFYQSGELFNILNCRKKHNGGDKNDNDNLVVLYRNVLNQSVFNGQYSDIQCGKQISINVGLKDNVDEINVDKQPYTFTIGEEPIKLLETYPLIKYALYQLKLGESATFVASKQMSKNSIRKKQTIYEVELVGQDNQYSNSKIPYIVNSKMNKFLNIKNQITCSSVATLAYDIYDINMNKIYTSQKPIDVKIGKGKFNQKIENILIKASANDKVMVFLTKQNYNVSNYIPQSLFDVNDIIVLDIKIIGVS